MSAIFSACGTYRHRLERVIQAEGKTVLAIGVNPSTAGATEDDATVRKWIGFGRVNGWGRLIVGNAFGFKATDVRELAASTDPVGPDNDRHLLQMMAEADVLLPCWGSAVKVPKQIRHRFATIRLMMRDSGKPIITFGFTKSGDPMHPLMLPYATQLIPWRIYT